MFPRVPFQVSLEFSDSSAVPGEQISMELKAQPKALCGMSAVDRSVFLKEPGRRLTADDVTDFHTRTQNKSKSILMNTLQLLPSDFQAVAFQEICPIRDP